VSSFLLSVEELVDRDGDEDRAGKTGFNESVLFSHGQALMTA
jgi:hypothetical protein